ncbi:MAG TPA: glycerol kinase GlpK [Acidimicrobiales bacterium]|nr:glycerol kinase GlpK [Acidimicrobiales bacterium]
MGVVIAIDAGTTGVRAFAVDELGAPVAWRYQEFPQHFPRPGWVEHDAGDILDAVVLTLGDLIDDLGETPIAAIGITNQRETLVAWDRSTGQPVHRALVWQDRRGAAACDRLRDEGHEPFVRSKTGLVLDPYFTATKLGWLLADDGGAITPNADLAVGTVDSWVLWNLTGGTDGGVHATDVSNASRTLLCDITSRSWDEDLAALFGASAAFGALPEIRPSSGVFGATAGIARLPDGIPIAGIAGDQQAALFGQACFEPGMTKNTYGTGSFVLMNVGSACPPPVEGLLSTVAWELADGSVAYALEGAIFVTGAAIQWMRDGLGMISEAAEVGPLAAAVGDTDGVFVVPAFAGLGSPWWDPYARGTITGITRGTNRAHIARAVVEAMAYQTRDVVAAMSEAVGRDVLALRVDGGASVMDLLCQFQADQLQVPVARSAVQETTALGAAYLAGLATGVWGSLDELASHWRAEREFEPIAGASASASKHAAWRKAVERSLRWAESAPAP